MVAVIACTCSGLAVSEPEESARDTVGPEARQHRIDRHLAAPDVRIIEAIVLDNRVGVVILEGVEFIRDLAVEFDNFGCHSVGTRRLFLFLYMYP